MRHYPVTFTFSILLWNNKLMQDLSSSVLAHCMQQQEASWLTRPLSETTFEQVRCNWQGEKKKKGQEMSKD